MNSPAAALLLLYYLLLPPRDVIRCVLWLPDAATPQNVTEACGKINLEQYSVSFRAIHNGRVYCQKNATAVYQPELACNLPFTLDNFKMEIFERAGEEILCAIKSEQPPVRQQIAAACDLPAIEQFDAGRAIIREIGPVPVPETPAPACQVPEPEQPAIPEELATQKPYTWLAGRLIWHGLARVDCDGYSGLDPYTLAANECGLKTAAPLVIEWQNQYDAEIYSAAVAEGVPAVLLKAIIGQESQFWPMWENRKAGETGLAQITPAAADMYLRWYDPAYARKPVAEQELLALAFIRTLKCEICTLQETIQKEKNNIPTYARILRAYRCASTDWRAALVKWNGKDYAEKILQ